MTGARGSGRAGAGWLARRSRPRPRSAWSEAPRRSRRRPWDPALGRCSCGTARPARPRRARALQRRRQRNVREKRAAPGKAVGDPPGKRVQWVMDSNCSTTSNGRSSARTPRLSKPGEPVAWIGSRRRCSTGVSGESSTSLAPAARAVSSAVIAVVMPGPRRGQKDRRLHRLCPHADRGVAAAGLMAPMDLAYRVRRALAPEARTARG